MGVLTLAAAQAVSIRGEVDANVAHHCRLARHAASRRADLVVFPELSLTGYELDLAEGLAFSPHDRRLQPLEEVAVETGATLVVGAPVRLSVSLHIGAFIIAPGRPPMLYTKRHPTPDERAVFAPGDLDPEVRVGSERVALAICADTSHKAHAEAAARRGASIYAAGVFFEAEDLGSGSDRLAEYATRHEMVVVMANSGAAASRFESPGDSAIWSASGERIAFHPGPGAGLAIASRREHGWTGETLPLD